ncbi:sucrose phosphorylase [Lacticaseibacillus salsurivasis]|uniref:sucrose phosphorylase n=1 Tax=Lacticaseibacillus salsurivasis TaxID=3081441 RepID=UPI0030C65AC2
MTVPNEVMLITYGDSMGENLHQLNHILDAYFAGAVGGVHLLPFFPSSGDRGFSPMNYTTVDPRLGSWHDVDALAEKHYLMVDLMINHLSRQSAEFQDYLQHHDQSDYAGMFLNWDKFWPANRPTQADVDLIYKRKDKAPYQEITFADGNQSKVWNTFSEEQIDLDVNAPQAKAMFRTAMATFAKHHINIVRLDAFAYAVKKLDTNDFFVEPDIWQLLESISSEAEKHQLTVLPEIHEHYTLPRKVSEHGYYTYDFALPMLILYTLFKGDATNLLSWLAASPMHQFTTLDTHDGIGIVDVKDVLNDQQIDFTTKQLYERGSNVKKVYSSATYNNLDIYQINTTYYSALGEDNRAYLLARALQIFAPGIPQIYYVGLLAGKNDLELLEATKEGRNINRHYYTESEVAQEVKRPVVRDLFKLLRFRNQEPAFDLDGSLTIEKTDNAYFTLIRRNQAQTHTATLTVDLTTLRFSVQADNDVLTLETEQENSND